MGVASTYFMNATEGQVVVPCVFFADMFEDKRRLYSLQAALQLNYRLQPSFPFLDFSAAVGCRFMLWERK